MSYISAIYRFELKHAWLTPSLILKPIFKCGNHCIFNELFTTGDLLDRVIGPVTDIDGDYNAHLVEFRNAQANYRQLAFEKSDSTYPYGTVKVRDFKKDCFLYRVISENIFEVYVAEGYGAQSAQILMMLMDGYLNKEIENLHEKVRA